MSEWLPNAGAGAPQQRVDELVMEAKASLIDRAPKVAPVSLQAPRVTALDLTRLRHAIESLADALSEDPGVVARHASKLQALDLASQLLRKLAAER